jgi:hypothetical protein
VNIFMTKATLEGSQKELVMKLFPLNNEEDIIGKIPLIDFLGYAEDCVSRACCVPLFTSIGQIALIKLRISYM